MDEETAVLSLRRVDNSLVEYVITGPVEFVHRERGTIILDFNPEDLTSSVIHRPEKETTS